VADLAFHVKRGRSDRQRSGVTPSALAERFALPPGADGALEALVDLVASDPTAPTTVTERGDVLRDHLADSLVALEFDWVRTSSRIADLGAGAGFPGLPLAVALPRARIALVESIGRKCTFMAHAAEACGIANVEVVCARAEEWRAGIGGCDLVTARAVAPLSVLAEYAAPLLCDGGRLVAWRGRRDPEDELAAGRAAAELGLEVWDPLPVSPYPGALHRHLHVMVKVDATPERFPRRAGMARKRPLGQRAI
jgi:16S rRNA (guanine527-N7)-methyltransferase